MTKVAISELKAKLAYYLRLVKAGEEIEILERGVSIATLMGKREHAENLIIPALAPFEKIKNKKYLAKLEKGADDPIDLLLGDRRKR